MRIYTGKGDDGTTGLLFGGRTRKDAPVIEANGALDEAQAAIGLARGLARVGAPAAGGTGGPASEDELDQLLLGVERDLWVAMAEVATSDEHRHKLVAGQTLVTSAMVEHLGELTDGLAARFPMPREFVLPGHDPVSAQLDVARTVVRRAERLAVGVAVQGSWVVPYLNRLSSLLWAAARWQEHGEATTSRSQGRAAGGTTGKSEE